MDCSPEMLAQFAIMGDVYFRTIFADRFPTSDHPRVGVLSIGEEESKGNELDVIMRNNYGLMTGVKATMPMFATALSKRLKRQVVDETGLKGEYDFEVSFHHVWEDASENAATGPTLFEAVDKLGLKLEMRKLPMDMIVVDKAEKPSEN